MKILTAPQVKRKIENNPHVKLIMTLGPKAYAKSHIPNSINVWNIEAANQRFSKDSEIIVYCTDRLCMASYSAYYQLEQAGYQNIWRFAGGLVEWNEAGYPLSDASDSFMENR